MAQGMACECLPQLDSGWTELQRENRPPRITIHSNAHCAAQSPVYRNLTPEEESKAQALVIALRDLSSQLDDQLEDFNLRDSRKRMKAIQLGDPCNSPCLQKRQLTRLRSIELA